MEAITKFLSELEHSLEDQFQTVPRWKLIIGTVSITSGALWLRDLITNRNEYVEWWKSIVIQYAFKHPTNVKKIQAGMDILKNDIQKTIYLDEEKKMKQFLELPAQGKSKNEILELVSIHLKLGKYDWLNGKISGGVLSGNNTELNTILKQIYYLCSWTNPLHADLFPGVRKMEAEIVRITANILNGDENTVGCMTTGGTESLILAMKAYRDWAREHMGIHYPEVIAAVTVHAAIEKGADILGYKFKKVGINKETGKANLEEISSAITSNTILVVGSAPEYAHGIIDDIEGMSEICLKNGIFFHVDCCLGGFILPFMEEAGYLLPPFDFRVEGVTSMSADTHKYGNCPKGTSVVLYRKKEYIHYQYFTIPNWPGGIYATASIPGSRAGANIATCWASLMYFGKKGYVNQARSIVSVARYLKKHIKRIPGMFVFGDPLGPVLSFGNTEVDIFKVADIISNRNWHLQPIQNPPGIQLFLTSLHLKEGLADELLQELEEAVEMARQSNQDSNSGLGKIYGLAASLGNKSLVCEASKLYLDIYYTSALSN